MAEDPVLLITGASSGIGAAAARRASKAGYRVALGARREDPLRDLAGELGGDERAVGVRCDVTEWDDNHALAQRALDSFGRIDAVFPNPGFSVKHRILETTHQQYRSMVRTNVFGMAITN